MLTFLFWNLKTKNIRVLTNLVTHHKVDVLILAECPLLPATILKALNKLKSEYYYTPCECDKIQLYTRFRDEYVKPVKQGTETLKGNDFTFRLLALPGRDELLLTAVHFPSKLRQESIDQTIFTMKFAQVLTQAEEAATHNRTILVGDLNMNPYEDGVVTTTGLHAVPTRRIALKEMRKVKFESNLYFYNPMWSHFGENKEGHAGTYYYSAPKTRADFWNIYDQVLVRPALLPFFRDEDVKILWQDVLGEVSLIGPNGQPNASDISDHLPLLFQLNV